MKLTSAAKKRPLPNCSKFRFAIIFSEFNDIIGNKLLENTVQTLNNLGATAGNIDVIRVPGSLEIPMAAKYVSLQKKHDAIIALGIVIKGDTPHFDLVINESHRGLMDLNLSQNIPVIFGILTAYTPEQAKIRAEQKCLNKGKEFAEAAVIMADLRKKLAKKKIAR